MITHLQLRLTQADNQKYLHPLPLINDVFDYKSHIGFILKIDRGMRYHQIRKKPQSISLAASMIRYGCFEFVVLEHRDYRMLLPDSWTL